MKVERRRSGSLVGLICVFQEGLRGSSYCADPAPRRRKSGGGGFRCRFGTSWRPSTDSCVLDVRGLFPASVIELGSSSSPRGGVPSLAWIRMDAGLVHGLGRVSDIGRRARTIIVPGQSSSPGNHGEGTLDASGVFRPGRIRPSRRGPIIWSIFGTSQVGNGESG